MSDDTLPTLVAVSRNYRCTRRELYCPDCGGDIELRGGQYHCLGVPYDQHAPGSPTSFGSLAELTVMP